MEKCIHCNLCRKNCLFLEKYKMDLGELKNHPELAYHCFLCGRCAEVCPKGIDGREIVLRQRREQITANGNKIKDSAYRALLWEKNSYKFSNYRHAGKKAVLFTGCNFPSFYPKTTEVLVKEMEKNQIGVLYECCGKPVSELGLAWDASDHLKGLEKKLREKGVDELVILCPNCYYYLRGKINIRLVTIYEKLKDLGIGREIAGNLPVYYPCPDRSEKIFMKEIRQFMKAEEKDAFPSVQCCGLGGMASAKEPELARAMTEGVICSEENTLYTYCASCISNFQRNEFFNAKHILPMILGTEEKVPLGISSLINRALCKWK